MKKRSSFFLLLLAIVLGCKKEIPINNESVVKLTKKASISNLHSSLMADSLQELRSRFNLTSIGADIPSDAVTVRFNSIEEATAFLSNAENSKVETTAGASSAPQMNFSKSANRAMNFPSNYFELFLPHASLIISKKFRFDWPCGFVIMGNIRGDQIATSGARWNFKRMDFENVSVDMYGFTFMSSYESRSVSITQTMTSGALARFAFQGMLKIVILIKDFGEVYAKPIFGVGMISFGPYYSGQGQPSGTADNYFNTVVQYTTR